MIRYLPIAATLFITALFARPVATANDAVAPISKCETHARTYGDKADIKCVVAASTVDQHLLFRATFLGSHDDTRLAITPAMNGQPLVCSEGSKTSSDFEDGDISLQCRFNVMAGAGTKQVLEVSIIWTHAQYAGFELVAQ